MRRAWLALLSLAILTASVLAIVGLHLEPHGDVVSAEAAVDWSATHAVDWSATHATEPSHLEASGRHGDAVCPACLALLQRIVGPRGSAGDETPPEQTSTLSSRSESAPLARADLPPGSRGPPAASS